MAKRRNNRHGTETNGATVGYEAKLWQMADALRGSMDAAEFKHVVLGLIFLKYIFDAFVDQRAKLEAEQSEVAGPKDPDEYHAQNIFWVPPEARWAHLKAQARQPTIGQLVDDAMEAIERDNPALDKQRLGQLIDMISNVRVGGAGQGESNIRRRMIDNDLLDSLLLVRLDGMDVITTRTL